MPIQDVCPHDLLVNLDSLPVGTLWRPPRGGDVYRKVTPFSHVRQSTGEVYFDERLYGRDSEPLYVSEVTL